MRHHTTFRQLEIFEAIARLGSFTRASEELFLTQPTVSMQMKKLTDTVGAPLVEQAGKKVMLTGIVEQHAGDADYFFKLIKAESLEKSDTPAPTPPAPIPANTDTSTGTNVPLAPPK